MKHKIVAVVAVLALAGAGCLFTNPSAPSGDSAAEPPASDDVFRLYDNDSNLIVEMVVRKQHQIGSSPCPDVFEPVSVEFPPGWGDVALPPTTNVSWLDLPETVQSGQPFEMGFNCNIDRFDTHGEVAAVNFDFAGFAADHPGIEHGAGAPPGGTFFVVTETWTEPPVADFDLPYVCCEDCASIEYCTPGE